MIGELRPTGDAARELLRFAEIVCEARALPGERAPAIVTRVGAANIKLARLGTTVVGGLALIPMGHWFGGRTVPCTGITHVAVVREHRSRGICSELLRTTLQELHAADVALSSLYPTSIRLYRAAGYELSGSRLVYRLSLSDLRPAPTEIQVRPATTAEDLATIRALYDARAQHSAGLIARTPYFWERIFSPFREAATAYLIEGTHSPEGYVVLSQRATGPAGSHEIAVHDALARSPAAAHRILRMLADHGSVARFATVAGAPSDALLLHAHQRSLELMGMSQFMLRIVHVQQALTQRGWAPGLSVELHLEVRDDLLSANARRWVLEVSGGRSEVRQGGRGDVVLDVRALAALYTGFMSCDELRAAGLCHGDPTELAKASFAFSGPAPWAADSF